MRTLARQAFQLAENNDDPCADTNGERWLVRSLLKAHRRKEKRPFVLIDAGANVGGYTHLVLTEAQELGVAVNVHAFEPAVPLVADLQNRFSEVHGVKIVGAGLGADAGTVPFFGESGSSQGSMVSRPGLAGGGGSVLVMRLDAYLLEHEIARVDLLKLDVEGFELPAMRGAGEMLRADVIDVVQFEYGGTALDAGTSLRDAYALLTTRSYTVAKLFPRALEARMYRPWMEHYDYANYVALSPRWTLRDAGVQ